VGSLTSATSENPVNGIVTFNDIAALCNPNGQLIVEYTAKPSLYYFDVDDENDYKVVNTSVWSFRSCISGERFSNGQCIRCVNGTYSLKYEEHVKCKLCPDEAINCYGNQINLVPGYWRISASSDTILPCPYNGCIGGYNVDQELCEEGYEGVLCSVCSAGYYYNQDRNECLFCKNGEVLSIGAILMIAAIFIVILILCIYAYFKFFKTKIQEDDQIDESALKDDKLKKIMEKMNAFNERIGPIFAKAKIIISTFQILSTSLASFSIEMPTSYTSFMSSFNFANIDFVNAMPIGYNHH
jgi:hypothetical protein